MEGEVTLAVDAVDGFNGKLDGKPLTVRAWADGDWANYEDENGLGSDGGLDTSVSFKGGEPRAEIENGSTVIV